MRGHTHAKARFRRAADARAIHYIALAAVRDVAAPGHLINFIPNAARAALGEHVIHRCCCAMRWESLNLSDEFFSCNQCAGITPHNRPETNAASAAAASAGGRQRGTAEICFVCHGTTADSAVFQLAVMVPRRGNQWSSAGIELARASPYAALSISRESMIARDLSSETRNKIPIPHFHARAFPHHTLFRASETYLHKIRRRELFINAILLLN